MLHLSQLQFPRELQNCTYQELERLAEEIRQELINTVAHRGGHLASNLGVVELTIALHRVFELPKDKLIFDVGHQSYVHKLLTGRYSRFSSLRSFGGLSGFPKRAESDYDCFETGHASTAISAALGFARARDFQGQGHQVVAVVGDGALTGGMCYEALNDAGNSGTRLIVVLNDNEMSISKNVGALSQHLTDLRVSKGWTHAKKAVKGVGRIPVIGPVVYKILAFIKDTVKSVFVDEGFFGALGFQYLGPIDGHDIKSLERTFSKARELEEPVLIHCITQKGHGFSQAEEKPEAFHGIPPFYVETGDLRKPSSVPGYGEVAARQLVEMARGDSRITVITAAMPTGTGMNLFAYAFPERMMDVGIAEQHGVTLAAGLAAGGMRPYFAVYATFMQRGYDQMLHDVCLQGLPVCLLLDRAGLAGEDGATHHGVFDIAFLRHIPNITLLAPRDAQELCAMIRWTREMDGPCAIRYPRKSRDMSGAYPFQGRFQPGCWEELEPGEDAVLLAVGTMVEAALETRALLRAKKISVGVVNCSTIKPLDDKLLRSAALPIITMEEHVLAGGFGSAVCEFCVEEELAPPILLLGVPDTFVQHGSREQLLKYLGLTPKQMAGRIAACLNERRGRE